MCRALGYSVSVLVSACLALSVMVWRFSPPASQRERRCDKNRTASILRSAPLAWSPINPPLSIPRKSFRHCLRCTPRELKDVPLSLFRHTATQGIAVFQMYLSQQASETLSRRQHETMRLQERHVRPTPLSSLPHPRPHPLGWAAWNMCVQLFWANLRQVTFSQSIETPTLANRARMSSTDFGFVRMSAGFVVARILMMRYRLRRTASCTHNSFTSTRCAAAFSLSSCWHPIDVAAAESILMSMGISQPSCTWPHRSKSPQWLESNSTTSRASLPQAASLRWPTCGTSCIQPDHSRLKRPSF